MCLDRTPNQQKPSSGTCGQEFALTMEIWSWTGVQTSPCVALAMLCF